MRKLPGNHFSVLIKYLQLFILKLLTAIVATFMLLQTGCDGRETRTMEVTATAFNSLAAQTHRDHPTLAAWGDTLEPGMKAIAVSRDLIAEGLTHGTEVKIEGLPGTYLVLDKMNMRWQKRIDIYMGNDVAVAKEWGRQPVTISWKVERE